MAGSDEVMARITRRPGVVYSALVPNPKGAELALAAKADELELVVSASETHNRKNVRRSVAESLVGARELVELAHGADVPVEAIVSTAFGCPYEGDVAPERVAQIAGHLLDAEADRLSFGDTTGMATPKRVHDLLDALEHAGISADRVGLHFHNTRGTALANVRRRPRSRRHAVRRVGRRSRRLSLRAGCVGQRGHRGPRPHARRHGHRDRHRPRRAARLRAARAGHRRAGAARARCCTRVRAPATTSRPRDGMTA